MFKHCFFPLALACLGSSSAMATVQIYGAADSFLLYARQGGQGSVRLESGGASTSRWGMYVSEDIGGGMRVAVRLENSFDLTSGRQLSSALFNREANIALSSEKWGSIKLGKQYPAASPEWVDPFLGVGQLSPYASAQVVSDLGPNAATIQARVDNAITYTTPTYGGLTATVLYAPRNVAGASPNAANVGALISFNSGPFAVSGSYNAVWSKTPANAAGVPDGPRTDVSSLSVVYLKGQSQLSLSYVLSRPTGPASHNAQVFAPGALWQYGPHVVRVGIVYRNVSGKTDHAFGGLIGYDYQFSKLAGLYVRAGGFLNYGESSLSFGADPVSTPGVNPTVFALGFRQKF